MARKGRGQGSEAQGVMADRDVVLVFNVCSAPVDYTVQKTEQPILMFVACLCESIR